MRLIASIYTVTVAGGLLWAAMDYEEDHGWFPRIVFAVNIAAIGYLVTR